MTIWSAGNAGGERRGVLGGGAVDDGNQAPGERCPNRLRQVLRRFHDMHQVALIE
ncbi:MAG TPA: hypothetical protein VH640_18980 [Bryobacteraceae bacterium]